MTHQQPRKSRAASHPGDNFKRLHGIGPAIERQLHNAGIRTFSQLASLSPEEIVARIPGLSAKRIAEEGWILEARRIVSGKPVLKSSVKEKTIINTHQHYANFTVELLLDENRSARRTRVIHVQTGEEKTWAGWKAQELINFVTRHMQAGSQVIQPNSKNPPKPSLIQSAIALPPPTEELALTSKIKEPLPAARVVTKIAEPISQNAPPRQPLPAEVGSIEETSSSQQEMGLTGEAYLLELQTLPRNTARPEKILRSGQEFEIHLHLSLINMEVAEGELLEYTTSIYTKNMVTGSYQALSEARGTAQFAPRITLMAGTADLPRGLYRLEVLITLTLASITSVRKSSLSAQLEGGLVQVY